MNRGNWLVRGVALISSIGLAAAALAGTQPAEAEPYSGGAIPTTEVIRGSNPADAQPSSAKDTPPIVLRGSPRSAAQPPAAQYPCSSGYDYDPSYGCVLPGYAYAPYDDGYWPYYGFDGFSSGGRRHGFRHGFASGTTRGLAPRFGHRAAVGPGHGFSRAAGLAHAAGFGRR
jgi:hypothetical protein